MKVCEAKSEVRPGRGAPCAPCLPVRKVLGAGDLGSSNLESAKGETDALE